LTSAYQNDPKTLKKINLKKKIKIFEKRCWAANTNGPKGNGPTFVCLLA
jgi:hypothetical protein